MSTDEAAGPRFRRMASIRSVDEFRDYVAELGIELPLDDEVTAGPEGPLSQPYTLPEGTVIGNRFCAQPMEGWDCAADGAPTDLTIRRWKGFGRSGAKLIWGGEATAVRHDGRANPRQLRIGEDTLDGISELRRVLIHEHERTQGGTDGLLVGLQITHSGRFSKPNSDDLPEPRIAYRHPVLDKRLKVDPEAALLKTEEVYEIIGCFGDAARLAQSVGYDFVDIKHCHGYLGHEFLSARTRDDEFGGSFENRTRFARLIVEDIRKKAPGLLIGMRFSAIDAPPYRPGEDGVGVPDDYDVPYNCGFGVNPDDPLQYDLEEPHRLLDLLEELGVWLVNITAGSPYYNPHIIRPAMFPPSDGYRPPEDPLVGVARHLAVTAELTREHPNMAVVGSGYTYLQEWVGPVAQHAVRTGGADFVGLGRMLLPYPEMPADILSGSDLARRRICRTFSDCTTAPRAGMVSGCYPLDEFYRSRPEAQELSRLKKESR